MQFENEKAPSEILFPYCKTFDNFIEKHWKDWWCLGTADKKKKKKTFSGDFSSIFLTLCCKRTVLFKLRYVSILVMYVVLRNYQYVEYQFAVLIDTSRLFIEVLDLLSCILQSLKSTFMVFFYQYVFFWLNINAFRLYEYAQKNNDIF